MTPFPMPSALYALFVPSAFSMPFVLSVFSVFSVSSVSFVFSVPFVPFVPR
ncbi:MAG: hypothetical protein R2712_05855 [Vicinamibacterales bacterium]